MTCSTKGRRRPAQRKGSPLTMPLIIIGIVLIGLVGWSVFSRSRSATVTPSADAGGTEMPHIHGMGFSTDGRQLIVAAHDGVRVFADGAWIGSDIPAHDYMGYSPTNTGFYSSGHPHTAGLINPFGLIKSTDGGKTLTKLGFEGESDFHVMGVGYASHTIYVLNPAPNSRLQPGLYSS